MDTTNSMMECVSLTRDQSVGELDKHKKKNGGTKLAKRKHKLSIEAEHKRRGMSADQIRSAKCQTVKVRNAERQAKRRTEAEKRQARWAKLTPKVQLSILNKHFGSCQGAVRQRVRLSHPDEWGELKKLSREKLIQYLPKE